MYQIPVFVGVSFVKAVSSFLFK